MYENYILLSRGFNNVVENGKIIGFQILVKIAYYRGVWLPLIKDLQVKVDGEEFGTDKILVTVGAHTYTFEETAEMVDVHWDFDKPLKLTVLKPGGLEPGVHEVFFSQSIAVSYMGESGRRSSITKQMTLVT